MIELMVAAGIIAVASAITVPITSRAVGDLRLRGDAHAVANSVALAKMRATSAFSRARLVVDLSTNSFFIQVWNKEDGAWTTEGGAVSTSAGVGFGFGGLTTPPPNTQAEIAQSPACENDEGEPIDGTACIVFNSRGIPIASDGAPTGSNALYLTDGTGVYVTTLTATPLVRLWWSPAHTTDWVQQ
jgi:type II secretory pathway pseudopilin PulG